MRSEAVEEAANLGVRPVGGTDEFAADDAIAIDGVGLRPHFSMEESSGRLFGIADGDQIDVPIADEAGVGVGIVVDADRQNDQIGVVVMELEEGGEFLYAWSAPGGPEIEEHGVAAIAGEVDRTGSVGDSEIGGRFSGLVGVRAPIAGGEQGQGEEQQACWEETARHIHIILCGR